MARSAKRESSGKARKPQGKKQFNAALTEQLVLDFNSAASEHGRDALLENLIFRFLEKVRPDSPSVLQFRQRQQDATPLDAGIRVTDEAAAELELVIEQREALRRVRDLATQIVEITTSALMRRPPKRTVLEPTAEKKQAV